MRRARWMGAIGVGGVVVYVAAWALAGAWWDDYDPTAQAISELFAVGAPTAGRVLLSAALVVTGVALVVFAHGLRLALPEAGAAAAAAVALSGTMTVLVAAFPCTDGCPPAGTTFTDTMHVLTAGIGYVALVLAPLLAAPGLHRGGHRRLAVVSFTLGGLALTGLVVRTAGFAPEWSGLQQRIFNTTADLWYVVLGVALVLEARSAGAPGGGAGALDGRR